MTNFIRLLCASFLTLTFIAMTNLFASTLGINHATVVKNLFNAGTGPADPKEFPQKNYDGNYIEPIKLFCAIIEGDDQPYNYNISRELRTTPAYGPLIPEKKEEKLVFGDSHLSYNFFIPPTVNGLDLALENPIYRIWMDSNTGVEHFVTAHLMSRKSGEYVAFKVFIQYNSSAILDEEYYGYCYQNGKALF